MMTTEGVTFTVEELAERWGKKGGEIEGYLRNNKLFCCLRLEGEFGQYQKFKDGNAERCHGKIALGRNLEDKYNRFMLRTYAWAFGPQSTGCLDVKGCVFFWEGYDGWTYELEMLDDLPSLVKNDLFITKEELERFERENPDEVMLSLQPTCVSELKHLGQVPRQTSKELCDKLKLLGNTDKEIAEALKQQFNLSDASIGKLVTELPGVFVEHETYRGRGRRLLGKR